MVDVREDVERRDALLRLAHVARAVRLADRQRDAAPYRPVVRALVAADDDLFHDHAVALDDVEPGARAGVVLNPATPLSAIDEVLGLIDYVLIMSVNPGFGGQQFIPYALDKVRRLDAIRRDRRLAFPIEIDGGITKDNVGEVVRAGCDWIVTGSSVFHTPDPAAALAELRQAAMQATTVRC